ncbi:MAG: hypothetical protein M3N56_16465 [Actinomycetota bacterium]|nr:hypothetical protein [Actinomycetota bacterium]
MADAGLFVGWGAPETGREAKGLEVFAEAGAFYGKCQEAGEIDSFEVVLLAPHGGGLAGFFLLRGSTEQCAALRERDDFQRILTRAGLVVQDLGVVNVVIGDAVGTQIQTYQEAIADIA